MPHWRTPPAPLRRQNLDRSARPSHAEPNPRIRDLTGTKRSTLAPGKQVYVKILSSQSWDGACRNCVGDTLYAWVIPQEVAQAEIARERSAI